MSDPSLTVRGTAPSGAEIVRDAGFGFWGDEHFQADADGNWSHGVQLAEGDNQLTFWLNDDDSARVTIDVRYEAEAPRATARSTSRPTAAPSSPVRPVANLEDAPDDLQDRNEERASGPGYVDIRELIVSYEDEELWLTLRMDADIPLAIELVDAFVTYGWFLDTNADDDPDYHLTLVNAEAGGWVPDLYDFEELETRDGKDFPGRGAAIGALATIRLDLDAIGNPRAVAVIAAVQIDDWSGSDPNTVEDLAPNTQWPADEGDWIRIQR